jgi:hypothetical protein
MRVPHRSALAGVHHHRWISARPGYNTLRSQTDSPPYYSELYKLGEYAAKILLLVSCYQQGNG